MSLFGLSIAYLRARALNAALNLILLALGVGMIVLLLLFSAQLEERLTRDARGIDLVIGSKGSPLQLILSSVYHVDFPTGTVPLAEAERWASHPLVAAAIPLALGDSLAGFRIVGTEHAYAEHYGAQLAAGRLWQEPFEATLGAAVADRSGLRVGDTFVGSHGLAPGGPAHGEHAYTVVGVLEPTASVVDRLVLTPIESVWRAHGIERDEHDQARGHTRPEASSTVGCRRIGCVHGMSGEEGRRPASQQYNRGPSPLAPAGTGWDVAREPDPGGRCLLPPTIPQPRTSWTSSHCCRSSRPAASARPSRPAPSWRRASCSGPGS